MTGEHYGSQWWVDLANVIRELPDFEPELAEAIRRELSKDPVAAAVVAVHRPPDLTLLET